MAYSEVLPQGMLSSPIPDETIEFIDERTPPDWWKVIPGVEEEGDWALYNQHPTVYLTDQQIHDLNRPLPDRGIHITPPPLDEVMNTGGRGISAVQVEQAMHDQALQEAELKKASEIAAAGKAYWDAALQGAIEFLSGGMMSTPKPLDEVMNTGGRGISKDEGRRKPVKIENLRGAKPGWKIAEGSNFWNVDEKDPYWQTKEGHKEAMNLYGTKPGWVKEPSLEYNPKTGEYEKIEKEKFVDIKPTKRISL